MSDAFVPGLRYPSKAHELWALVVESLRGWEERVTQAAAEVGLSQVSAWALVQLDPDNPISQKELAARLHCNPSTVVDPTDRLERLGLVIREAHPADRRVNVLVVTAKGRQIRQMLLERLFEPPAALRRACATDLSRFQEVLRELVDDFRAPAQTRTEGRRRASSEPGDAAAPKR